MKRAIYHGSREIISKPIYGKGSPTSDYGLGFYTTLEEDKAALWALRNKQGGFVNCYDFDDEGLNILRLDEGSEKGILYWISILIRFRFLEEQLSEMGQEIHDLLRLFPATLEEFDVIIGYRADDNFFSYASGFAMNSLSFGKLEETIRLGNLGKQYVLKSRKAFERIKFVSAKKYEPDDSYSAFLQKTNREYRLLISKSENNPVYLSDLIRKYKEQ